MDSSNEIGWCQREAYPHQPLNESNKYLTISIVIESKGRAQLY